MRPIRGFERPATQWLFVGVAVVLILVTVALALALRREIMRADALLASEAGALLEQQRLEIELGRERTAIEALSIQVGRLMGAARAQEDTPTLTLTPPASRTATPPDPTVPPPEPRQIIALRLVLPPDADPRRRFSVAVRNWSSGDVYWMRHGLTSEHVEGRQMVIAHISGDVLARGAYEILLTAGDEAVAAYEVTVG